MLKPICSMKKILKISLLLCSFFIINSCTKYAGPGGSSSIKGVLMTEEYNQADSLLQEYPKANEDIFIIYGEGSNVFSDKISSSYDGSFRFDYLEKGKYSIFVYEDCATCPDGKQVKLLATEITKSKSTIDLGSIGVKKIKNSGTSKISGNIHVMNYDNTGVFVNEGIGPDEDVYLVYGSAPASYASKIKSNYDGTFTFNNVAKGHYTIYAYSKCTSCPSGLQAVIASADVVVENSTVDVGQITINK